MTEKVKKALTRLISILPLKEKQESCGTEIKNLHQQVLRSFVERGRILSKQEMAKHVNDVEHAVAIMKNSDMIVFSETGEPVGAYPFTMEEREHEVLVNGHEVHAMCALDALSVSPMFGMKTQVSSKCRITGSPVVIHQSGKTIDNPEVVDDIRFGIIWGAASACSCCANSLCMEMMFLKNKMIADAWLTEDPANREVFSLDEAVEFGAQFFTPLMS